MNHVLAHVLWSRESMDRANVLSWGQEIQIVVFVIQPMSIHCSQNYEAKKETRIMLHSVQTKNVRYGKILHHR